MPRRDSQRTRRTALTFSTNLYGEGPKHVCVRCPLLCRSGKLRRIRLLGRSPNRLMRLLRAGHYWTCPRVELPSYRISICTLASQKRNQSVPSHIQLYLFPHFSTSLFCCAFTSAEGDVAPQSTQAASPQAAFEFPPTFPFSIRTLNSVVRKSVLHTRSSITMCLVHST